MKKTLLAAVLATVSITGLFAGETLQIKLVPDRSAFVRNQPQEVVVKIDLSALAEKTKKTRTPLNLAVVMDKSGSMTGAKLEKTKQAAMQLVDRLAADDVFSLVTFSDRAQVVVPAQKAADKDRLKAKIQRIQADGSTALFDGVKLGADQITEYLSGKRINRVILLSDGLANVGPSSPRELRRLGSDLAEKGITTTTIGVGDDYNEDLMAGLAEAGDANYYYVKDTEKLADIFAKELGEMISVAVRDVRIQIICPEGVKPIGFIGRGEKFNGQRATITLSQFSGGQNRTLFLRCQVNGSQTEVARVNVNYRDEYAGGDEQSAESVVRIVLTDDASVSEKSVNHEVAAQKVIMLAAVARDEATAEADAGNYQRAAQILATQNAAMTTVYASASPALQSQIKSETQNLDSFQKQLEGGRFDSAARKSIQSQSYNMRNSK